MPTAPNQTLIVGQTQRIHVRAVAADGTTTDTTSTLACSSGSACSATVDPADNRAIILQAFAPGSVTVTVDESPALPAGGKLTFGVTVTAPPDLRHVEFVSADPATP